MYRTGDKVWVYGEGDVHHYGIIVIRNYRLWVVHNSKIAGQVVLEPFEVFSGGLVVHIEKRAKVGHEESVASQALDLIGARYNLLFFNCEHFVNYVQTGISESPQLQNAIGWATAFYAAFKLLSLPNARYDSQVGRYRDNQGRFVRS